MLMSKLETSKLGSISPINDQYGNQLPVSACAKRYDHKT